MYTKINGNFKVEDFEINGVFYAAEGTFEGTAWYLPGRMYMPNGDPGYPEENEVEWTDYKIESAYYLDEEDNKQYLFTEELPSELIEKIEDTINECLNNGDFHIQKNKQVSKVYNFLYTFEK